jgi:hypothetical protein
MNFLCRHRRFARAGQSVGVEHHDGGFNATYIGIESGELDVDVNARMVKRNSVGTEVE